MQQAGSGGGKVGRRTLPAAGMFAYGCLGAVAVLHVGLALPVPFFALLRWPQPPRAR